MKPDYKRLSYLTVAFVVALSAGEAQAWPKLFKKKNKGPAAIPAGEQMKTAEMTATGLLSQARADEAAGREGAALKGYQSIVTNYPYTSMAPVAQFHIAAALEKDGKYEKAFDAYQDLITKYRQSPQFSEALDRQYNIAMVSRTKKTGRTLGFKTKVSGEDVVTMLKKVIANAPQGPHAADAQYEIAMIHDEEGERDLAIAAYRKVVDNYPRSTQAAEAQTRIGRTYMAKVQKGERDGSNIVKANEAAQDATLFGNQGADLMGLQSSIDEASAESSFATGKFYQKRGSYKAAMMYYADILRHPGSPHYDEVRDRVNEMSAKEPGLLESVKSLDSRRLAVQANSNLKNKGDYFGPPGPVPPQLANSARPGPVMRGDYVPDTPLEPGDLPATPGKPDPSLLDPNMLPPLESNVPPPPPETPVAPEPPSLQPPPAPPPPPGTPVEEKPAIEVEQPKN